MTERFDAVVMATHADEGLALLERPDARQSALLGSFGYTRNETILHSDLALMPRRRRVWSAWNYLGRTDEAGEAALCVTYWMNRLQSLPAETPLFVTLNPIVEPDPALVIRREVFHHPKVRRRRPRGAEVAVDDPGRGGRLVVRSLFRSGLPRGRPPVGPCRSRGDRRGPPTVDGRAGVVPHRAQARLCDVTTDLSAIYEGQVVHQRLAPRRHHLRYALFQMLFDLDHLPDADRRLRWFSYNRLNLFSFFDRDHGDGRSGPLRGYVEEVLSAAGLDIAGGPIRLLCMPRMFGHVFNPISIYWCHRADGGLAAMLYEVNNTFGQRHSYLVPAESGEEQTVRQSCGKALHVSPFMDMAMRYEFVISPPLERISTSVNGRTADGAPMITANFSGARHALTDARLLRNLLAFPLMTLKVVAAIHWEAVKLIAKGVKLRPAPPNPDQPVTFAGKAVLERHETIKQSA